MHAVTQNYIEEKPRAEIIEPMNIEWKTLVVFAPEKNEKLQVCVEYRGLNIVTVAYT